MRKVLYGGVLLLLLVQCSKPYSPPDVIRQEPEDPRTVSDKLLERATTYVDLYFQGSVFRRSDTLWITLLETRAPDSIEYRKFLDTASVSLFRYVFAPYKLDPPRWQQLMLYFEIMYSQSPRQDTVIYFPYLLSDPRYKF